MAGEDTRRSRVCRSRPTEIPPLPRKVVWVDFQSALNREPVQLSLLAEQAVDQPGWSVERVGGIHALVLPGQANTNAYMHLEVASDDR